MFKNFGGLTGSRIMASREKMELDLFEAGGVFMNGHKFLPIVRGSAEEPKPKDKIGGENLKSKAFLNALPDFFSVQDEHPKHP